MTLVVLATIGTSTVALSALQHPPRPVHTGVQLCLLLLSLTTFLQTHFTPPGTAADWHVERPDLLHPHAPPHVRPPPPDHCGRCDAPKPPRVHHCTTCDACALRYDHHCPWLHACVGLRNHKPFLLYLLYTALLSLHAASALLRALLPRHARRTPTRGLPLLLALLNPPALAVAVAAGGATAALFAWNLRLAARNRTALEHLRHSRHAQPVDYDGGALPNLRHVLGWDPCTWLLPLPPRRTPPAPALPRPAAKP